MEVSRLHVAWILIGIGFVGLFGPAVIEPGLSEDQIFWVAMAGAVLATTGIVVKSLFNLSESESESTLFGNRAVHVGVVSLLTFLLFLYFAIEIYAAPF